METAINLTFEHAPIGLVLSENRTIKCCNDTFCEMVGYEKAALIGQSFAIFYASSDEYQRVRDVGMERLRRQEGYTDERMLRCKGGNYIWCRFRAHTLTPRQPLRSIILSYAPIQERPPELSMTLREKQVIAYLADGMTSKVIARRLQLSPRTVEDVRARLLRKFKVKNTAELLCVLLDVGDERAHR